MGTMNQQTTQFLSLSAALRKTSGLFSIGHFSGQYVVIADGMRDRFVHTYWQAKAQCTRERSELALSLMGADPDMLGYYVDCAISNGSRRAEDIVRIAYGMHKRDQLSKSKLA